MCVVKQFGKPDYFIVWAYNTIYTQYKHFDVFWSRKHPVFNLLVKIFSSLQLLIRYDFNNLTGFITKPLYNPSFTLAKLVYTTSRFVKLVIKYYFNNRNDLMRPFRVLKMKYSSGSALQSLHGVARICSSTGGCHRGEATHGNSSTRKKSVVAPVTVNICAKIRFTLL